MNLAQRLSMIKFQKKQIDFIKILNFAAQDMNKNKYLALYF